MQKIQSPGVNLIQFLPYFPPHAGGLETVAEELSYFYAKKGYGEVVNVVFDVGQLETKEYSQRGYIVYLLPSFDIIPNFPVPKFWKKEFWEVFGKIKNIINPSLALPLSLMEGKNNDKWIIQTHTRFFLSSFIGGLFAKKHKIKWVHVEHGSDYVKLGSTLKSKVAYIYDRIIGKWIFNNADEIVAISDACRRFIQGEFKNRNIEIIYRGLEIDSDNNVIVENLKEKFQGKIIIGFVGRILKWKNVDSLIKAYYLLDEKIKNKIQLVVVGDGEELNNLRTLDTEKQICFTGTQPFANALALQKQFDIHFHTSSPGGGLATTLLQAMKLGCFIVATPYEGANEVIQNGKNGILLKDDQVDTFRSGIELAINEIEKKEIYKKLNNNIIEEKFDWDKNIEEYFNLYKSL